MSDNVLIALFLFPIAVNVFTAGFFFLLKGPLAQQKDRATQEKLGELLTKLIDKVEHMDAKIDVSERILGETIGKPVDFGAIAKSGNYPRIPKFLREKLS